MQKARTRLCGCAGRFERGAAIARRAGDNCRQFRTGFACEKGGAPRTGTGGEAGPAAVVTRLRLGRQPWGATVCAGWSPLPASDVDVYNGKLRYSVSAGGVIQLWFG